MKTEIVRIKNIDKLGRLVIPKNWREKYARNGRVIVKFEGEKILIEPYELPDLTELFDKIEIDLKSDLSNWKSIKRELLEIR
ncbi:MAG: AbrB/MazE/SpoVT family DNA-binding domain-containing protein [Candidatus Methanomethylicia archaeon]